MNATAEAMPSWDPVFHSRRTCPEPNSGNVDICGLLVVAWVALLEDFLDLRDRVVRDACRLVLLPPSVSSDDEVVPGSVPDEQVAGVRVDPRAPELEVGPRDNAGFGAAATGVVEL